MTFIVGAAVLLSLQRGWAGFISALVLMGLLVQSVLSAIRGYTVTNDSILVQRLLWTTPLERKGLKQAHIDPEAMRGAARIIGNGGAYSFSGRYRSKHLGRFRVLATNAADAVVLDYGDRKIVVTPDDPEGFVRALGQ